ncbi:CSEP0358 putative effector protein [Blumeria hordei DH14]|uniref:CSEP0358 putative effector protein n=1 Tax=Blumeria graminis f. sp. hordei (strain DH14) TaxID=546991 RepID=N1J8I6_BLUG1|nr:CSEP0358 putative effector protein [Blumeria hordei DH14]
MRFLSIATLILLVDLSVSLRIHDDYNIFRNGGRRPILNSNFGMTCQLYSVYNVNQILDFTRTAYQIIEDPNQGLDTCTFDPFPQEVLYIYRIGTTYLEDTGMKIFLPDFTNTKAVKERLPDCVLLIGAPSSTALRAINNSMFLAK